MIITTVDSHKISVRHLRKQGDEAVVLAHGLATHKEMYLFKQMEQMLHKYYDVFSFDFRGHGESEGVFSWTAHEAKDLHAIISCAQERGYRKIGLIGFSLGAAASLIAASQYPDQIKSIISVSAPSDLWKIDFRFWEREMLNEIKFNLGPKAKGKFVRIGNPFQAKIKPIDAVAKIASIPILFIHGKKDWLIKPYHSQRLFAAAKGPKELEIIEEGGHAEMIFDRHPDVFERLCVGWFRKTIGGADESC